MHSHKTVDDYQRRMKELPQISKQIQQQIRNITSLVQDQQNEINTQNVKIKLLEQQLGKMDKILETRENQIQQLTQSQEKSAQKEKKYFMQIQNYNKKIQILKGETSKISKNVLILKKQIKTLQTSISTANSQKNKVLQQLTKGQLKLNSLTQTLNQLKMKAMQKNSKKGDDLVDTSKRDEKQLNDLFLAIKKQMQLIDVLKKQKVHLMASTIFKYCQEDFTKLLEINNQ